MNLIPSPAKLFLFPAAIVGCIFALRVVVADPPTPCPPVVLEAIQAPFVFDFTGPTKIKGGIENFRNALKTHSKDGNSFCATYNHERVEPTVSSVKTKTATASPAAASKNGEKHSVHVSQRVGFADLDEARAFLNKVKKE